MENQEISKKEQAEIKVELDKILNAHGVQFETNISFPQFRILPDEVNLALTVLQKNEMVMSTIVVKKSKKEETELLKK